MTPLLIADLEARSAAGLETYGRPLQTFNGRNAAQDALEEALDLAQYLKQVVLEQAAGRFREVEVTSAVCCHGCHRMSAGSEMQPAKVILEDADGLVSIFCGRACANLPEAEEREHQGTSPFVNGYGKKSSICLLCDVCGIGFDPTWKTSRMGCPGGR